MPAKVASASGPRCAGRPNRRRQVLHPIAITPSLRVSTARRGHDGTGIQREGSGVRPGRLAWSPRPAGPVVGRGPIAKSPSRGSPDDLLPALRNGENVPGRRRPAPRKSARGSRGALAPATLAGDASHHAPTVGRRSTVMQRGPPDARTVAPSRPDPGRRRVNTVGETSGSHVVRARGSRRAHDPPPTEATWQSASRATRPGPGGSWSARAGSVLSEGSREEEQCRNRASPAVERTAFSPRGPWRSDLLLAVVTPALAPGARRPERDRRGPARNVLLLHAYPRLSPPVVGVDEAFRATLEARVPLPGLLLHRVSGPHPLRRRRAPARAARAPAPEVRVTRSIDLIVAAGAARSASPCTTGRSSSRGLPSSSSSVDRASVADLRLDTDVTGTWLRQDWAETLDLARRLQPDIRSAVVVGGVGARRSGLAGPPRASSSRPVRDGSRSATSTGGSIQQIMEQVASLPARHGRPGRRLSARRDRAELQHAVRRSHGSPAPPACPSTCSRTTPWAPGAWAATW